MFDVTLTLIFNVVTFVAKIKLVLSSYSKWPSIIEIDWKLIEYDQTYDVLGLKLNNVVFENSDVIVRHDDVLMTSNTQIKVRS